MLFFCHEIHSFLSIYFSLAQSIDINAGNPIINNSHLGMVYTTHQNGDDLGMVYGMGFTTLHGFLLFFCQFNLGPNSYYLPTNHHSCLFPSIEPRIIVNICE